MRYPYSNFEYDTAGLPLPFSYIDTKLVYDLIELIAAQHYNMVDTLPLGQQIRLRNILSHVTPVGKDSSDES